MTTPTLAGIAVVALTLSACGGGTAGPAPGASDDNTSDLASGQSGSHEDPGKGPDSDPERDSSEPDSEELFEDNDIPIDEPVDDVSVLDEDYFQRVIDVLDANYIDVVEPILEADDPEASIDTYEVRSHAALTFTHEVEDEALERLVEFAQEDWLQLEPEPLPSEIVELQTVTAECVSAEVVREAQPLYDVPLDGVWYVTFRQREEGAERAGTIWRFAGEGPDQGEESDGCE